jgi:D-3-phosphoglycerate dehydrogenase / 2-oxoglutarate reductase
MNQIKNKGPHQAKKPILVISAPMEFVVLPKELHDEYDIRCEIFDSIDAIYASENMKEVSAWIVSPCPTFQIGREVVGVMPDLKIIVTPSTGVNHLNIDELKEQNIEVRCLLDDTDYLTITASSEFSFLLIMAAVRKLPLALQAPIKGDWRNVESKLRGRELSSLKLGLYGCGRIGSNVGAYAHAFGMRVFYFDPYVNNDEFFAVNSLEELFSDADIILLCPYLNEHTRGSITSRLFNDDTRDLILVNSSRGEVVDEEAITMAIKSNQLGSYYTDVLQGEVDGSWTQSPLLKMAKSTSRVFVSPHIAGLTNDSESKAQLSAIKMALQFLDNQL